ncbi:MAG: nucleotidyltransferase family protein [Anaerolineae bacterium]
MNIPTSPTLNIDRLPVVVRQDLQRILEILKRHGAQRIILYGSYARGTATPVSDLDLCEEGIPATNYFRAWAECLMIANIPVSILDLASVKGYLRERILREGKVLYAA